VNRAGKLELLRVPGLGEVSVNRILQRRAEGGRLHALADIGRPGKRLRKAAGYVTF
jgi:predicted DNA-binding helix-hairpin-helix protein